MSVQPTVPQQHFTNLNQLTLSLQLGSFRSEILGWGLAEPRWWRNYLHTHSFFEICYAFEGQGLFRINNEDYQVHKGQVLVAKPGETHEIISSESTPLGIYFWSYTLTQRPDRLPESADSDSLLTAFLTSQCWVSDHTPAMQRTLELLTEEAVQREPGYLQAITALTSKLLLDTARAVVTLPPRQGHTQVQVSSSEETAVQIMVRYLRDNYARPIAIRDVATQVYLSERHSSRLFHKIMGRSIMDYLSALRLETAAQLLLERNLSIKEIAQTTGYSDVRYFTTLFHRHTGLPPATFRQKGGTSFVTQEPQQGYYSSVERLDQSSELA